MRFALKLLFLFLLASPLMAQDQEQKMMDRLRKENTPREFNPGSHGVGGLKSYNSGAARTKDFYAGQKSSPGNKNFSTKDFAGSSKGAWKGDFKYATTAAKLDDKRKIPNADKKAPTKTAATKDATERNKTSATRAAPGVLRPFLGPESKKLTTAIYQEKQYGWKGNLDKMSIDDIRDLLNKTK